IIDSAIVNQVVGKVRELGAQWAARSGDERAEVLEAIGVDIVCIRGKLVSVVDRAANKTMTQTDPEISEAINFCVYYAHSSRLLYSPLSTSTPHRVTVVTPPWNFPIAIPTGGMMAALAAGSAVIIKPAPQVVHCAKTVVDAIHQVLEAKGLDKDLVQLVYTDEGDAGKALMSHADVDNVILTGASDTGQLFRSWRPEMNLS